MNTQDVPQFKSVGFDSNAYASLQKEDIRKRIRAVGNSTLYLEIGGKLFHDPHAARVLPGFKPDIKVDILKDIAEPFDIVFCINYSDILSNRQLYNHSTNYIEESLRLANQLMVTFGIRPHIAVNKIKDDNNPQLAEAIKIFHENNFDISKRYYIEGYPEDSKKILGEAGYGKDEYIPIKNKLVIVTGSASNSGKMSTCLGQIYHEAKRGLNSGYAKYETFPIWNLPLEHPINLAYEAATADIGDHNVIDIYHEKAYQQTSVNYNRDADAFRILKGLTKDILPSNNLIQLYKSPTDMGINNAGFAIINDELVSVASYVEIIRRKHWYQELVNENLGEKAWVKVCEELEKEALQYLRDHDYNPGLDI
jgi:uncharacterized protein (UPF0371 family)